MWKPASGNTLHGTQLAILKRSLELVKVGGYVCYSTCSLNPVEDEAVVAAALVTFGDTIELVKITNLMQRNGWIHRPGVHSWKVAHYVEGKANSDPALLIDDDTDEIPKLTWYPSYDTAKEDAMDGAVESLWSNDSTKSLPLERCARLFPQDFDSGGFFLALFRKIK
jgi:16S rRNA C967 or C1407 C5-methylase (RsmB/RsmF family)